MAKSRVPRCHVAYRFFSTSPYGTCQLSVSCQYLALDGVYHPLWAAFTSNPTPRRSRQARGRYRPHTVLRLSLDQKDSGPGASSEKGRSRIGRTAGRYLLGATRGATLLPAIREPNGLGAMLCQSPLMAVPDVEREHNTQSGFWCKALVGRSVEWPDLRADFLPASTVCRPLTGECDLPEFCTGSSSHCPINLYLKDGHTCSNGNLYCSGGICLSADKQCQEIWGEGAKSAEHTCYRFTNKAGNEFGNCGKDENDEYIKCKNEDVDCGKIQCKGGNPTPIRGGNVNMLTTKFIVKGVKYECRGTFSTLHDSSAPDLIRQGTKCGDNKACFETKCQDVRLFNVQNCDQTCNNKGVCNNKDQCHCQEGWAPPFCAVRGIGGSIDSGPMNVTTPATSPTKMVTDKNITTEFQQKTQDTTTMAVAIAVPALTLLNVAGFLTWYKMKKTGERSAANETDASERTEENRFQFLRSEEVVQVQSPDKDASITLQYPLPNTKV
ncbi:disintegrin and metalloproteinase domain-containing protein 12-like [Carcharodon carcharias]|uniref:disintegrin and metalloproteinase domain-containing protein 12-like n=1 Tax=Carcharodon carcharias TaxID=13397 RepID=UPI001B7E336B|nr:disintegrin and metalloproteinase domain-containing protein 12-like [Carcharodon carcharias]